MLVCTGKMYFEFRMEIFWPDSVAERDFEGIESDDNALIDDVVSMVECMGLKVESEDVHELLKSYKIELVTE